MKKMTIQEFDQDYIQINHEEMFFEDSPTLSQIEAFNNKYSHHDDKHFNTEYMASYSLVQFGEIGKYRVDGIPFGYNAYIFTIEQED